MLVWENEGIEGKVLHTLYWKSPDDELYNRYEIFTTERGRDKRQGEVERIGLVCQPDTLVIPKAP